ncbi:thiaminase II [Alicyclobacillus fastidiosus]|uniref:Aminopyrimidine aminohydrolase n=1 Tax=Alicyclobacillus fastidiosus TaxID=392011 RepID=A0ABV5A9C6_9BACL|nr:thiaminase II [Alicyclobacillus fastidiosus]WEH10802.1 thiaminase II [Alicyclobacillus fastidiosus]
MRFSEELRRDADPIFQSIRNHPFVQGIQQASLGRDQIVHYVQQDYLYLTTYAKVYGLGLAKCRTREEMQDFHRRIGFILNDEVHPHITLCRVAGVSYESLQVGATLAPTAQHYMSHMLLCAQTGSLGEVLATVLPCHWTYVDLATDIMARDAPTADHPFYDWIAFYAARDMQVGLADLCGWIDNYAATAGEEDKLRMRAAFMVSCQLERRFFEMAYSLEKW